MIVNRKSGGRFATIIRFVACLTLLVFQAGFDDAAEAKPRRIVSLNLCTDELLIRLADPENIASLTFVTTQPELSLLFQEALKFPINFGTAEEVLRLSPDLVLAGTYTTPATVALLSRLKYPVVTVAQPQSIKELRNVIHKVASAIGEVARGEALISRIDGFADGLTPVSGRRLRTIVYQAGWATLGRQTLLSDTMERAGLVNIAPDIGITQYLTLPLEATILGKPDLIIIASEIYQANSIQKEALAHPALARVMEDRALVAFDPRWWGCGSIADGTAFDFLKNLTATGVKP